MFRRLFCLKHLADQEIRRNKKYQTFLLLKIVFFEKEIVKVVYHPEQI